MCVVYVLSMVVVVILLCECRVNLNFLTQYFLTQSCYTFFQVGYDAVNDSIILESFMYYLIRRHFKGYQPASQSIVASTTSSSSSSTVSSCESSLSSPQPPLSSFVNSSENVNANRNTTNIYMSLMELFQHVSLQTQLVW